MPQCRTKYFETVSYEESAVLRFPAGLPGFENEHRFLSLGQPVHQPLVFLQSLATPQLCFVALPVQAIDPAYELEMDESDRELLGLDPALPPARRQGLLALALVTIEETGIVANLFAPVVVNTANLSAVQAISPTQHYSNRHPLGEEPPALCS